MNLDVAPVSQGDVLELHVSDALIFRDCRRRWKLGSMTQMNLEPDRPITALWMGTAVHYGLEHYYKLPDPIHPEVMLEATDLYLQGQIKSIREQTAGLTDAQDEELLKGINMVMGILEHYASWAPTWDVPGNSWAVEERHPIISEVVATEQKFSMPLMVDGEEVPGVMVHGRMDGVIRDQEERLWVLEHKTAAQIRERHHLLMDEQPGVYMVAAAHILGEPCVGVLYNIMRKKLPAVPERLVAGGITVRKNIDTTYTMYMLALEAAGQDPCTPKYAEILDILAVKGNTFFKRVPVERSPTVLNNLMRRLQLVAHDMKFGEIYASPNPFKCSMCAFEPVCIAMEDGAHWQDILRTQYRVRRPEVDPDDVVAAVVYSEAYEEVMS